MVEAPHGLERNRLDLLPGSRRNFEHPAVILVDLAIGPRSVLFAGQPAAPRRDAASAIADRPGQRAVLLLDLERFRIEHDGGRAAGERDQATGDGIESRTACPAIIMLGREFVVADERNLAIAEVEAAHAIRPVRHCAAIVHRIAQCGDDLVGKAHGQVEQPLGIGHQRAIARSKRRTADRRIDRAAAGHQRSE